MPIVQPIKGSCWEGSGPILLARIVGNAGTAITQATVTSIACKVFDLDGTAPDTAVAEPSVAVASTVYDSLQTSDPRWTEDVTGYNFLHQVAASVITEPHRYRIEYKFTPSTGQPFYAVFEVTAVNVRSE